MESKVKGIKGLNIATIVFLSLTIGLALVAAFSLASLINYLMSIASVKAELSSLIAANADIAKLTAEQVAGMFSGTI